MICWGFLYNISDCKIYADLLSFVIRSAYCFSKVPRKLRDMLQPPLKAPHGKNEGPNRTKTVNRFILVKFHPSTH